MSMNQRNYAKSVNSFTLGTAMSTKMLQELQNTTKTKNPES
jgi:hypothetical protein